MSLGKFILRKRSLITESKPIVKYTLARRTKPSCHTNSCTQTGAKYSAKLRKESNSRTKEMQRERQLVENGYSIVVPES